MLFPGRPRSLVLAAAVVVVGLLAGQAQAGGSGARFTDPSGDGPAPSLDLVSGAIRLETTAAGRILTMSATMASDLTGVPGDYDLVTGVRSGTTCYSLATRVRWNGATLQQSYQHTSTTRCQGEVSNAQLVAFAGEVARYAVGGDPVDATAGGRTVSVTLPAPSWLRPGQHAGFGVLSHTTGVGVMTWVAGVQVATYDMAGLGGYWRVG